MGSLFLLDSLDWNRSIDGDVARRVKGYFIVRGVRHQSVADARLDSAEPIVATAGGEQRIRRAEHHHATTTKVGIAGAANLARAANRGAHLLHHVRQQAGLFRIDFGHHAFEFDLDSDGCTGRDRVTQVKAQSCFLIVESEWDGRAVACGANLNDFKTRLVGNQLPGRRFLCGRRVTSKANVWIKMKENS